VTVSSPTREVMSDEDLRSLREAVRDVCARHAGPDEARRLLDATPDGTAKPHLWNALVAELGVGGLLVPERFGGVDAGWTALSVVLEELGRGLAATPFVPSSVLATTLLLESGNEEACEAFLPGIAEGGIVATVAVVETATGWDDWTHSTAPSAVAVTATSGPTGWSLSGRKRAVSFGATADLLLVTAGTSDGTGLFAVERGAAGVTATALATLDGTRPVADLVFADTPAREIALGETVAAAVSRALDLGGLAVAAEDVGAMRSCLESSVEYAKLRTQFDRPIGSFQAIKHKCAAMLVDLESSRSAAYYALWAAATGHEDLPLVAPLVKAHCVDTFVAGAGENIQIHGGIGFTWEHPAHLYLKRAKSSQLLLGDSDLHRQLLAERIGI
jgi:alkylation response protein AidB-like acyl-CoA dehydrogenase